MLYQERLFNKFIDIEFTREINGVQDKLSYKSPLSGVKPNISIFGKFIPNSYVTEMTVKIVNFTADADLEMYKYMRIVAGYRNGPYKVYQGTIINSYVEKPNPEGVTVFQCVLGELEENITYTDNIILTLDDKDYNFSQLFSTFISACQLTNNIRLPNTWKEELVGIKNTTYTFKNKFAGVTWLKNIIEAHRADNPLLTPLMISFSDERNLNITGNTDNDTSTLQTVLLENVTSAYFWGAHISIKAPWNPNVETGQLIQMPSNFFRGRIGSSFVSRSDVLFNVLTVDFVFSTHEENSMTIDATIQEE